MSETFSGKDIVIANMLSKSTLRVAAETFARNHPCVDYFPSFDMISAAPRDITYKQDCLHVRDEVVGAVMDRFLSLYLGLTRPAPVFDERTYLSANPDVEALVRLGQLTSGYEHWKRWGQAERRSPSPHTPTPRSADVDAI